MNTATDQPLQRSPAAARADEPHGSAAAWRIVRALERAGPVWRWHDARRLADHAAVAAGWRHLRRIATATRSSTNTQATSPLVSGLIGTCQSSIRRWRIVLLLLPALPLLLFAGNRAAARRRVLACHPSSRA